MKLQYGIGIQFLAVCGLLCLGCDSATGQVDSGSVRPALPAAITNVMSQPRYRQATWSLMVRDVASGQTFYQLHPTRLSFTGSTRKLFSVGLALKQMGPDRRQNTTVHRLGTVNPQGQLQGNLALRAGGDLTFGGRRLNDDAIQVTDFDHNDANSLGTAILNQQDPLLGVDRLAEQVRNSGITSITGDVVVDSRLFQSYRVPNGNLLVTPMMLNENQIDVSVSSTQPASSALTNVRPQTAFFQVLDTVKTGAPGSSESVEFSGDRRTVGVGGSGTVSGQIPSDYRAPLSGQNQLVGTFRVEDPDSFCRIAFIEALQRHGVAVAATKIQANQADELPATSLYSNATQVARFDSVPWLQHARLILKVSLNLGANVALSHFGLEKGESSLQGALKAERRALEGEFSIEGSLFAFPTNGSGTPDSQAAPKALVDFLVAMARSDVGEAYQSCLPILGVDGSLATTGKSLPGRGRVFAKTGTSILPDGDGQLQLKAQCLAGYIQTRSGRKVAYALMVNDAGTVRDIAADVGSVFEDEALISSIIYEEL